MIFLAFFLSLGSSQVERIRTDLSIRIFTPSKKVGKRHLMAHANAKFIVKHIMEARRYKL